MTGSLTRFFAVCRAPAFRSSVEGPAGIAAHRCHRGPLNPLAPNLASVTARMQTVKIGLGAAYAAENRYVRLNLVGGLRRAALDVKRCPRTATRPERRRTGFNLMPFGFQQTFHFDSGHASHPGRGHSLPVDAILNIASVKYSF